MIYVLEKRLQNNPFADWAELRTFNSKDEREAEEQAKKFMFGVNTYRLMKVEPYGRSTKFKPVKIIGPM